MTKKNDGGFVYQPYEVVSKKDCFKTEKVQGITRRDWLAGLAMQGIVSNPGDNQALALVAEKAGINNEIALSKAAYEIADAMIEEGNKTQSEDK